MIQLVALIAVAALVFSMFALLRGAGSSGARPVPAPASGLPVVREGTVAVPLPAVVVVPAAFLVDPTLGLAATGVFALVGIRRNGGLRIAPRRSAAASNVAFAEWRDGEEARIARMREELDGAEAAFALHLEERRAAEDRREFDAYMASGGRSRNAS